MKRVFTLLLGLMLICSIAVASPVDDLLSKYQDMRLGCEAGINRLDYSRNYRELYVATRKQENTIDKETYDKFMSVLSYYEDAKTMWECDYDLIYKDDRELLKNKYPTLRNDVYSDIFGNYGKTDMVNYIMKIADKRERELETMIQPKIQQL